MLSTIILLTWKLLYTFLGAFRKCAKRKVSNEIKQGLEFIFTHFIKLMKIVKEPQLLRISGLFTSKL